MFQQVDADGVVAGVGGGDDNGEEQAEGVGDDAAFASAEGVKASALRGERQPGQRDEGTKRHLAGVFGGRAGYSRHRAGPFRSSAPRQGGLVSESAINQPRPSQNPPRSETEVVELRVHGVSGADANEVLDRPNVHQVAGDLKGGFFRPRPGYGDSRGACRVVLEAYRWSELPSGAAARTLSLVFLLPFMLCNTAIWMRPRATTQGLLVWIGCRLIGLTLTALYVLSFVGVALDLIACKCMSRSECLAGRNWFSWLGGQPVGLRLALLSLLPLAAIVVLWRLGARCGHWYENFVPPQGIRHGRSLGSIGWQDALPAVRRLRAIHVATAFAVLDLSLLLARASQGFTIANGMLAGGAAAVVVTCVFLLCLPRSIDSTRRPARVDVAARTALVTSIVLTVVVLVRTAFDLTPWPVEKGLPGHGPTVVAVFAAQFALLAVLAIAALWGRRVKPDSRLGFYGLGAPLFASFAVGLATIFATEFNYRVADYLDRDQPTATVLPTSPVLGYKWTMFGFFVAVFAALAAGVVLVLVTRHGRMRAAGAIVSRDFPTTSSTAEAGRKRMVQEAIARAQFTETLGALAVTFACVAALSLAVSALGLKELQPAIAAENLVSLPRDFVNAATQFGSYLMALVFLGLLIGGLFAYRTFAFRRYIGILWDLGMFWPRAAHPFAPPCYAERAVPELARRTTALVREGNCVLLASRSHGSVLAAAAVLQLEPDVLPRVALLTDGSPLRRLYASLFPMYVGDDELMELGGRVGWRWINLWRDTDSIGSWIFSSGRGNVQPSPMPPGTIVDRRLRDPRSLVVQGTDTVAPPIQGHFACPSDGRYEAAVCELADRLRGDAGHQGAGSSEQDQLNHAEVGRQPGKRGPP
ncbi:hypothetical protein ACL02O_11935 [Micromonospora sp. MS34]|uniref:hypothetical protein n=1 Tax=Micromonospora sp. MS34 TaxID=3385971 RepID=UPI0039A21831